MKTGESTNIPITQADFDDSSSKTVWIEVTFFKGQKAPYKLEATMEVDNISDAEIKSRIKTALEWAEKGFNCVF